MHAVNIFRARFNAHQNDALASGFQRFSFIGIKDDFATGRTNRLGQVLPAKV